MEEEQKQYLECERWPTFILLMVVGGWLGAFTYMLRGGAFCNAQTANVVLMAMALGQGDPGRAAYYLIPMSAYVAGAVLSEYLPRQVRRLGLLRWDTVLVGVEALVVLGLGLLPDAAPVQITQVAVNFICSMQYNTFRQAQGVPMATTFCTNHFRQTGIHLANWLHKRQQGEAGLALTHLGMIAVFTLGAAVCTALCGVFGGRTVWGAAILLAVVFLDLLRADLGAERGQLGRKPGGH